MTLDPARALGLRHGPVPLRWSVAETARYARAVGAERLAPRFLEEPISAALPMLAATLARSARPDFGTLGLEPARVIHLSQGLELRGLLQVAGEASGESEVTAVYDLGEEGAMLDVRTRIAAPSGVVLATTWARYLARGGGGFGGRPAPSVARAQAPARPADVVFELSTRPDQAETYSALGDTNPIHLDAGAARAAGFERPILHGLCTFGLAGLGMLQALCDGNPASFTAMHLDYLAPVYPGDTLRLAAWREAGGAGLELTVPGRAAAMVCRGRCSLRSAA